MTDEQAQILRGVNMQLKALERAVGMVSQELSWADLRTSQHAIFCDLAKASWAIRHAAEAADEAVAVHNGCSALQTPAC